MTNETTDSILLSVKKMLGIDDAYNVFDNDLIMHINAVLMILTQIGVGKENFIITGKEALWTDFLGTTSLDMIKPYVYLKVKLLFDPPQSSSVTESINHQISELEWRMNNSVDPGLKKTEEDIQNV